MSINITGIIGINGGIQMSATGLSPPPPQTYYSNLFDGTGDMLTVSNLPGPLDGDFTYEAWAYPTSDTSNFYRTIFGIDNYGASTPFRVYQYNMKFEFWNIGAFAANSYIVSPTIAINQWYHLAITRSGTTIRFFLNGVQAGTLSSSVNYPTSNFRIGMDSTGAYPFVGFISNLRAVNGTAVYTSNFTPPTAPLTAISGTSLLTCQSATIVDNSPNNFPITVNGDVAVSTQNPFN